MCEFDRGFEQLIHRIDGDHATRKLLGHLVRDPENELRSGEAAFGNFPRMLELATRLDWPVEDVEFMRDTYRILLLET